MILNVLKFFSIFYIFKTFESSFIMLYQGRAVQFQMGDPNLVEKDN